MIPGQLGKCTFLMAQMSVEGTRLSSLSCRKAESSALVALD